MQAEQKVAIVTGASKGIGAGLVTAFLDRGYAVIANSRNIAKDKPFPRSDSLALVEGDIADSNTSARITDRTSPYAAVWWTKVSSRPSADHDAPEIRSQLEPGGQTTSLVLNRGFR